MPGQPPSGSKTSAYRFHSIPAKDHFPGDIKLPLKLLKEWQRQKRRDQSSNSSFYYVKAVKTVPKQPAKSNRTDLQLITTISASMATVRQNY